jgi:CheY-like chemotaxis protein
MRTKRFLLVEDEPLIGLLLAEILENLGHVVVHEAATLEAALQSAALDDFDAAILDTNLHGKPVFAVAELLTQKQKPFFFSTGYTRDHLPDPWKYHRVMEKPFDVEQLKKCLTDLFDSTELPSPIAPSLTP